jgi:flagellar basal-body rod modification protein FlgD
MSISSIINSVTNPTTPTTTPTTPTSTSTPASTASTGAPSIASNFTNFLQLLTTQLQHQDPSSPLDSNQFTSELVQFASVEQQINMNSNLSTMISLQQTAQSTASLGFLGTTVTVNSNSAQIGNGQPNPTWNYAMTKPSSVAINVANSSGQLVYSSTQNVQAGSQTFAWNGQDSLGNAMPAGTYTVSITATDAAGNSTAVQPQVQGVVSGVDVGANPPTLTVNGQSYTPSQVILAVRPAA